MQMGTKQNKKVLLSFSKAVERCVRHSLGSYATEIHVDIRHSQFTVIDNGNGVSFANLRRLHDAVQAGEGHKLGLIHSFQFHETDNTSNALCHLYPVCLTAASIFIQSRENGTFQTYELKVTRGESDVNGLTCSDTDRLVKGTRIEVTLLPYAGSDTDANSTSACLNRYGKRNTKDVRACVNLLESLVCMKQHVTLTIYDRARKRFMLQLIKGRNLKQYAQGILGISNKSMSREINHRYHGWHVGGWTVLPPVGYGTRARQRIFVNDVEVQCNAIQYLIDSLFLEVYRKNMKLLPPGDGQLSSIRKQCNHHAMFVLILKTEHPGLEERFLDMSTNQSAQKLINEQELLDPIKMAILESWAVVLSSKLLQELHAATQVDVEQRKRPKLHTYTRETESASLIETVSRGSSMVLASWPKRRHIATTSHLGITSSSTKEALKKEDDISADLKTVLESWKNPAMMPHLRSDSFFSSAVITVEKLETKWFRRLKPTQITKRHLLHCRVLRQIDKKFIPIVCQQDGTVALIDQHAADERIRLEQLQAEVFNADGTPKQTVQHWALPAPQQMCMWDDEWALLEQFEQHVLRWGWRWAPWCAERKAINITHLPLICGRTLTASDMKVFLYTLSETGKCNIAPPGVHRLLASKACRSAIMFGDELDMAQSRQLARDLGKTDLFFECAHGRPTVIPLINLHKIHPVATAKGPEDLNVGFQRSFSSPGGMPDGQASMNSFIHSTGTNAGSVATGNKDSPNKRTKHADLKTKLMDALRHS